MTRDNFTRLRLRTSFPRCPAVPGRSALKPALAVLLSCALVAGIGVEFPAAAAPIGILENSAPSRPKAKDKKLKSDPVLKGLPITELSADEAILHALNRLAYGPRPGDVAKVREMGLAAWINRQLAPNAIDDHALASRLENFPTLAMSTTQLMDEYPAPKQAAKAAKRADPAATAPTGEVQGGASEKAGERQTRGNAAPSIGTEPSALTAANSASANPATRGMGGKAALNGADPNAVPRAIADNSKKPQRVVEELAMAKLTRAIYSERQLQQIMDDFWFNHFNVYAAKGEDRWYLTAYERDVIEPHSMGKFKDLLAATAQSPAMLFYLDNFLSVDPNAAQHGAEMQAARRNSGWFGRSRAQAAAGDVAPKARKTTRGLNENYGRELMELHTLGVDGGYTQKDVTELARCFTGWTIEQPRQNPQFKFNEKMHDPQPKVVLKKKIHAGGMKDGEEALELLARHPSTAKFISTKLARRFVSDNPPATLVARMSKTFESSDGDITAMLRAMIYSPEFWSRDAYRAKIKTPLEVVVSAVRALGTDVDTAMPLVQWVARIGEPLYQCQPPTGYADKAEAWVSTGALLNRLNFSLALAGNKIRGSRTDISALLGTDAKEPKDELSRAVEVFLGGQAGSATVATLRQQLENPQVLQAKLNEPVKKVDLGVVSGLVLGAPEFQRR